MARRFEMTDEQWIRIEHLLPGRPESPGATARDNRLFVDAVLWIARTGAGWRDLPERFGEWNTTFQRFNRWAKSGVWARVLEALGDDADMEHLMIDSTVIRAHQHSAGAEKRGDQAIGRSRGGVSTKVHVAVDALGNPVRLIATGGQVADVTQGKALISDIKAEHVIADKGYDSSELVGSIEAGGAKAVIPPRSNRKEPRDYDGHLYKERNLVERFLNKVKNCRRIATRYEKTARNYLAIWHLASIMVLLA